MKKICFAASAAAYTCTLFLAAPANAEVPVANIAQSVARSVELYGLIDLGVEHVSNVADGNDNDAFRVSGGTSATSYLGFRSNLDIGHGLKVVWNLESGFNPDAGTLSQGGRIFGRAAYLGLEGSFGRLTIGRQFTMRYWSTAPINPFGVGNHGLPTLDNGLSNPRADNGVSYRFSRGGFETGVNYSFGRDSVSGNSAVATNCPESASASRCHEWSALLKYDGGAWGVTSSYERDNGGTQDTYGGLTSPGITDSRLTVGGYYKIGATKLATGLIRRDNQGVAVPKSNLVWLMGQVPVSENITLDAMLAQLKYSDSPNKADAIALRGTYALYKGIALYVTADYVSNAGDLAVSATAAAPSAAPPKGESQLSVITGMRVSF